MSEPRIGFFVTKELQRRIDEWPWGTRATVFRTLAEMACDFYDKHGAAGLGALVEGKFQITSDVLVDGGQNLSDPEKG